MADREQTAGSRISSHRVLRVPSMIESTSKGKYHHMGVSKCPSKNDWGKSRQVAGTLHVKASHG